MIEILELCAFVRSLRNEILLKKYSILKEEHKDIKIEMDIILQDKITDYLLKHYEYPILSEELKNNKDFKGYNEYVWILDPLDGSLNYSRDIPLTCISLALWKSGEPNLGIIYDFMVDTMYWANAENLMNINDQPVTVSGIESMSKGIICTGFPSWRNYETESLNLFVDKVKKWKKVRLLGSAALSLAWVASGKVEAYIEEDIRIWDVAAGFALVKFAGGDIYLKPSDRDNFVTAVATNGRIKVEEVIQ